MVRTLLLPLAGCLVPQGWPEDPGRPTAPGATAAGALEGTVTDRDGSPIASAFVTSEPGGVEATAGEDGAWRIDRLLPGTYRVIVAAPGWAPTWSESVVVGADEVAVADARLERAAELSAGNLRVRVSGPDDAPWAGAHVTATAGDLVVAAETDAEGVATLAGLGGLVPDVRVEDPSGRLHPRTSSVEVPEVGDADLALTLSGSAAEGTRTVGSLLCSMCHTAEAASWEGTAHARAQSEVEGAVAVGFDEGETIDLGDAVATLGWADGAPVVEIVGLETQSFVVAGVIGGNDRGAVPWIELDGFGWPLPVAWVAPDPTREGWSDGGWIARDTSLEDPEASAEARCFGCHATGFDIEEGLRFTPSSGDGPRWAEGAVGCERCHGPGEEHTSGPYSEKSLSITNPAKLDVDRANEVCAQCHAALVGGAGTPYAWSEMRGPFLPGDTLAEYAESVFEAWISGTASQPGAQADELAASAHGGASWDARCTDCHDPHGRDIRADLRLDPDDNTLCVACHASLDAEAHGAHPSYAPEQPAGEGRCVGCHMPLTSARSSWSTSSGAGDLASHLFVAVPPSDSLQAFDAAGADTLEPGEFAPNACQECHAWNAWLGDFAGPGGDMTGRAAHEALQAAFDEMYP